MTTTLINIGLVIGALGLIALVALVTLRFSRAVNGLFIEPPNVPMTVCPRCGQTLVTWTDVGNDNGWDVELNWTACPVYRQGSENWLTRAYVEPNWRDHYALWRRGKRSSHAGVR